MGWREKNRPAGYDDQLWWWRGWHPGIARSYGGRKRKCGRSYRAIRTTQERRRWDAEFSRAARSWKRLPDAWDERPLRYQRTWKRHRKTQWKPAK